jgi:hypothetical protein
MKPLKRKNFMDKDLAGHGAITLTVVLSNIVTSQAVQKGGHLKIIELINNFLR